MSCTADQAISKRPLKGQELGDGTVHRVIARVQQLYYDPPILGPEPRWGR